MALHLLLLLLFWPWAQPEPEPQPLSPPSVAMVFESGKPKSSTPKQSPEESLPTPPVPPAAPPTAQTTPAPPPRGTQAPPTPPDVSLASPSPPSPELPLPPPVPVPEAPEPLPVPSRQKLATLPNPQPVRPRPPSPERPQVRNGFPVPMNFSYGGRTSTPTPLSKAFADYSTGPASRSAETVGEFAKVTKGKVAADWMNELRAWWIEHRYYPNQAAMAGEDGMVQIEITVDRYGKVHLVDLLSRSGSQWLDMGAQSVFRNANLPPLPPDTRDDEITLDLTINYILVRR